jgi:S-formylglutathione hydrolase FrmB
MDAASWTEQDPGGMPSIARTITVVFGQPDSTTRVNNDLHKLYLNASGEKLRALPYLYLDCGTEDVMFDSNRRFSEILVRKKIPHELRLLPGTHGWVYWDQQIIEVLRLTVRRLQPAR